MNPNLGASNVIHSPINITSPDSSTSRAIFIDVGPQKINYKRSSDEPVDAVVDSLQEGLVCHIHSKRFGLNVDYPMENVGDLLQSEASSNLMNLYL
ncbi:hypothetical protein GOP47_0029505, partial [Adiantum capillus-veneris]